MPPSSHSAPSSVEGSVARPSRLGARTAAQWFCLIVGILLAQRTERGARLVLIPFAIFYAVLAIVGDINGHEAFGLLPVDTRDKFIHPIYAVLALLLLAAGWRQHRKRDRG